MSQLNQFKDASGNWLTGQSLYLVGLVLLTMLIIWGCKLTKYPCFINCNFGCFGIVVGFGIDTRRLVILLLFKVVFHPFTYPIPFNLETLVLIFPYAVIMAGVGLMRVY
jgi:SulP family sulfate permease